MSNKLFYNYIDSGEIPLKILFLFFTCENIGVAMVTHMISQLQESFPLRRTTGSFEISFTKWLRDVNTVELLSRLAAKFEIENITIISFMYPL